MKEFLKLISSLLLIYYLYLLFKWVWESGVVGKIVIIIILVLGVYNSYKINIKGDYSPMFEHEVSYPKYVHLKEIE